MIQAFAAVKDGGQRTLFKSGALRERPGGKGRFDLIPAYCLFRLALHYENGAKKYHDRNWEKGLPLSSFVDSAFRHLIQFMGGDRSEDHWAAISWNAFGYMYTEEMIRLGKLPNELADFPTEGPFSLPPSPVTTDAKANGVPPDTRAVRGPGGSRSTRRASAATKARPRRLSRGH